MNFKQIALSIALAASALAANAGGTLTTTAPVDATYKDYNGDGSLNGLWTFNLSGASNWVVDATATRSAGGGASFSYILDGGSSTAFDYINPTKKTFLLDLGTLTAGNHSINFSGFGASTGHIHLGADSIAAVPEPETYAMMLAGLGAMGFIARRRKANGKA